MSRNNIIKQRKNFLPALLLAVLLWLTLAGTVFFIDPFVFGAIYLFFILVFLCLLFTFSLLFAGSRRGFIFSFFVSLFLLLRYLGIGHLLNSLLLAGLAITIELYFARK